MGTAVVDHRANGPASSSSTLMAKSPITRMLQHSILQLCNEHIGYSHKLQILGVLCMTVDDEQQEIVVKVNNTLKRVAPQQPPQMPKDIPTPQLGALASSMHNVDHMRGGHAMFNAIPNGSVGPSPVVSVPNPMIGAAGEPAIISNEGGEGSATPLSNPRSSSDSPNNDARRSHGRKRSKPVKVQNVFDEGEMMEDDGEDGEVLTVIPTDPDHPEENMNSSTTLKSFYNEESSGEEEIEPRKRKPRTPRFPNTNKNASTASPNVRALLQQSIARHRAATNIDEHSSQLRSALLNGAPTLHLPLCVAPEEGERARSVSNISALVESTTVNGDIDDEDGQSGSLQIDEDQGADDIERSRGGDIDSAVHPLNESLASVKDEPKDDYDWSTAGQVAESDMPQDLSATGSKANNNNNNINSSSTNASIFSPSPYLGYSLASSGIPDYSGLSLALSTASLQLPLANNATSDGLTIRYTPTGPITVGANGKNVSQQKVKDIIMYDDQSPLNQQKGARLETDFMVDKMGVEGRKRRRRGPDETLTSEEIAEYLGAANPGASTGAGIFKCKYCTVEVGDLVQYLQHTLADHNAYICHQCGKNFTTKSSLLRHRPIHTGMRRFACSICKKTFYRKDKCKAHIKRHLGSNGEVMAEIE